jgi:CobQ-like glutamine amidotransferase family enzyme
MNCYGDMGNAIALRKRLEWRGFEPKMIYHHPGEPFPRAAIDIVLGGGGQDSGQLLIHKDLLRHGAALRQLAERGVPMLMVCGLYQLFGQRFVMEGGDELAGIGIFNVETIADVRRLVGNALIQTPFGQLVGYENHSGRTTLFDGQEPFGTVLKGFGNADGKMEGAVYRNVHGTYLHGAVLPRNPAFADALLRLAVENRYGRGAVLAPINDQLAARAAQTAKALPT